jgi:hypothetical protein
MSKLPSVSMNLAETLSTSNKINKVIITTRKAKQILFFLKEKN